jgi:hypothetical protein
MLKSMPLKEFLLEIENFACQDSLVFEQEFVQKFISIISEKKDTVSELSILICYFSIWKSH